MNRIIVPIDFSESSLNALKLGIIYANSFLSDLQMVYVQDIKSRKFRVKLENEYMMAVEEFEEILSQYRKKLHLDCDFSYIIKKGRIFEEIVNQAEAFDNSMIICSATGESGFSDFIIGSNAYKIIQNTEKPVISVSSEFYIREVKTIVLPLDYSKETREKVHMTVKIAKAFNAEVHIIKVATTSNKDVHKKLDVYASQVKKVLNKHKVKYQSSLLVGDNITNLTNDYAKTVDADLISIMTEQSKAFTNLLLGSYAQQMLNTSKIPILSITPKQALYSEGFKN